MKLKIILKSDKNKFIYSYYQVKLCYQSVFINLTFFKIYFLNYKNENKSVFNVLIKTYLLRISIQNINNFINS